MIFTQNIQKAIEFAEWVHRGQPRKGKRAVYITHPLAVGLILARVEAEEEIIMAGILHDTIEDSNGQIKREDIERRFGSRVAGMVNDVTEQDKSLPWEERKRIAREHVAEMSRDSLLVKCGDVLQNLTEIAGDFERDGDAIFERFTGGKEKQLETYSKLAGAIASAWPESPLLPDIRAALEGLL